MTIQPTEILGDYINQNGIKPGPKKLEQFKQALTLRGTPKLYSQDGKGYAATAFVKITHKSITVTAASQ